MGFNSGFKGLMFFMWFLLLRHDLQSSWKHLTLLPLQVILDRESS
jgi:hypothetical protein